MAFPSAPGYGQFPNGNFSAVIYSKKVQLAFRKSSVVEDITNNDYFGEIAQMGDSVKQAWYSNHCSGSGRRRLHFGC